MLRDTDACQDVMMPDVDGIELLRHIRSDEAFNSMPVVSKFQFLFNLASQKPLCKIVLQAFLTGPTSQDCGPKLSPSYSFLTTANDLYFFAVMSANEHTDTVFECIQRGAEDYLLKPVTKKEVQYICQHVWRRRREGGAGIMGTEEVQLIILCHLLDNFACRSEHCLQVML